MADLGKIVVKKKNRGIVNSNSSILDDVINGAGEKALETLAGKDIMAQSAQLGQQAGFMKRPQNNLATAIQPTESPIAKSAPPSKGNKLSSVVGFGKELGRGLIKGALGMPNKGDSNIPFFAGRLPGDVLRTKLNLQTAGEATQQNITNQKTPLSSSSIGQETFQLLQGELAALPPEVLADPAKYMPEYRKLIMKYPGAQSFLDSYFGLKRNYNYDIGTPLAGGKYTIPGNE